jgi:hypothetical protein
LTYHDFADDDRAPRHFVPSGKMDRLPDGGQFMPSKYDIAAKHERDVPALPEGLRTGRQRKQFELDRGMLLKKQAGWIISDIASWYDVPRARVYEGLARCKKMLKAQRAG